MISKFIVMHPSSPIFELDENEWSDAVECFPDLNNQDPIMSFYPNSATAYIEPKKDNYFDNEVILRQFERLFKLLRFKNAFYNHDFEIMVDNATTHSAKLYDVQLLNKSPGTQCPYRKIVWMENGIEREINCFDEVGVSKGLLTIAKELGLVAQSVLSRDIKLEELRQIVSTHKAFENCSKLERLAEEYDVKIIWIPKYHCEFNPIEGLWCHSKRYVRKYNDQSFDKLNNLIMQSFDNYKESNLNAKLWNRFWTSMEMYNAGATYKDVLSSLFGAKHKENPVFHRKNFNFNTTL